MTRASAMMLAKTLRSLYSQSIWKVVGLMARTYSRTAVALYHTSTYILTYG